MTDPSLAERSGRGARSDAAEPDDDGDLFAAALAAELPRLVGLAARLVHDPDAAEDCAQETIVGAWRRRDQLRERSSLAAWLRRSLVNRVIDRARARHDELDIDAVEADWRDDSYSVQPDRVLERAELRDELQDALARLPVIYRLPVVLHDVVGWTAGEIGRAMDASLPATKQRLRRGRMMLVSALAEDDERRLASLAQPLRCWRARRHVSAYLDGELDAATRTAVETHLESCPTCPPLYASLVGVRATLEGLRDPDTVVEGRIAERIRVRLGSEPGHPGHRPTRAG
jgi:RNA polymerase sigma-70 factor, ECF subfamily